jgi:hypothetical protein
MSIFFLLRIETTEEVGSLDFITENASLSGKHISIVITIAVSIQHNIIVYVNTGTVICPVMSSQAWHTSIGFIASFYKQ